ncbi:hypothetical protein [Aureibaculum luteum]|uniref:hypothetical protein n=1 Tax=Aureibaculum luteum TaxID=1548456 RepID=UPI000E4AEAA8|nr:hypothetical protein [Aureibaculum luteum]
MDIVLNELSFENGNKGRAIDWYNTFFDTCISIGKDLNTQISVVATDKLTNIILDREMMFEKWLSTVSDRDKRFAIISMASKKPILHDYPYYYYEKKEAKGLGFAYENELLPISLDNNKRWHELSLDMELHYMIEESLEVKEENLTIIHSWDVDSSKNHLAHFKKKLNSAQEKLILEIKSGTELWENRAVYFSHLKFCESTRNYLNLQSGIILKSLCGRLLEMNNYFSNWENGDFERNGFGGDSRLESETRQKKLKTQLTIECPDNENRLFSFHCNYGTKDLRLHFFPDNDKRICYIGYVGKKIN